MLYNIFFTTYNKFVIFEFFVLLFDTTDVIYVIETNTHTEQKERTRFFIEKNFIYFLLQVVIPQRTIRNKSYYCFRCHYKYTVSGNHSYLYGYVTDTELKKYIKN